MPCARGWLTCALSEAIDLLPHRFPFRLVDRSIADQALWRLSAGATLLRSGEGLSPVLLLELLAQTALVMLSTRSEPTASTRGYLVGIDRAELPSPGIRLTAGDDLRAVVRPAGSFAGLVRLDGEVWRGEDKLLGARLSLALERAG